LWESWSIEIGEREIEIERERERKRERERERSHMSTEVWGRGCDWPD